MRIRQMLAREPSQWELVSAVIRSAVDGKDETSFLAKDGPKPIAQYFTR
jgi:hypothetical protein